MPTPARAAFGLTDTPNRHFDTVIMGRGTYEPGLRAGMTSSYAHLEQYVVSTTLQTTDPGINVVREDPADTVRKLKSHPGKDIWLAGGGKLASALLPEIDQLVIKRNPLVIGSGIPLFAGPFNPTTFLPVSTRSFDSGLRIETYTR
ncbi:dihydrofolate reductase family protein [Streptomyces chartreusis]|uniref:dihydrofolate reductase family protein n=1 Tax=Streptomyces chartreusis TaxID=1969 RepID=UPI002E81C473|nr:dihydrofolate reductase family protein [Streptomyces chartreusis]